MSRRTYEDLSDEMKEQIEKRKAASAQKYLERRRKTDKFRAMVKEGVQFYHEHRDDIICDIVPSLGRSDFQGCIGIFRQPVGADTTQCTAACCILAPSDHHSDRIARGLIGYRIKYPKQGWTQILHVPTSLATMEPYTLMTMVNQRIHHSAILQEAWVPQRVTRNIHEISRSDYSKYKRGLVDIEGKPIQRVKAKKCESE
jgi:hypothetical protein